MNKIKVPIQLNMDQRLKDEVLKVNQYDTNIWTMEITLIKDGVTVTITDLTARMWCEKPDGTHVYKNCAITDGKIVVDAGGQMFTAAGMVDCEIELSSTSQTLGSPQFLIKVVKSVKNEGAMESTDEYTALNDAITAAAGSADAAKRSATDALASKNAATTAAGLSSTAAAESAESARKAATSATNAEASNKNAATHETAAKNHADTAATYKTAAGLSATAAAESETAAARYAAQTAGVSTISWYIDPKDGGLNMIYNPDITTTP